MTTNRPNRMLRRVVLAGILCPLCGCGAVPVSITPPVLSDDPSGRSFGVSDAAANESCPILTRAQFDVRVISSISSLNAGADRTNLWVNGATACVEGVGENADDRSCATCWFFIVTIANLNRVDDDPADDPVFSPVTPTFRVSDATLASRCPGWTRVAFTENVIGLIDLLDSGFTRPGLLVELSDVCDESANSSRCLLCLDFLLSIAEINRTANDSATPAPPPVSSPPPLSDPATGRSFGVSDALLAEKCPSILRNDFDDLVFLTIDTLNAGVSVAAIADANSLDCQDSTVCLTCLDFTLAIAVAQ